MKKFFMIALLMVSVLSINAKSIMTCMVVRNNGSTVTVTFNMVEYYDIDSEAIPYAQYLRPHTYLLAEVGRVMYERFNYTRQYYSPMEAIQQLAIEKAKYNRLKVIVANLGKNSANGANNTVSRDSNYEARKKADAKRAAQEYAAKRDSQRTAQPRTSTVPATNDSSRTTTTTGSFASGM